MIFNPTKLKEYTKQLLFALLAVLLSTTVSHAEYSAVYFDARLDMGNHRLNIYPRESNKMDSTGFGFEDEYVNEWYLTPSNQTDKRNRSGEEYNKVMEPRLPGEVPYKNTKLDSLAKKFSVERTDALKADPSSKKNTIPAALYTYKEGNQVYGHSGLKSNSNRLRILKSSICGSTDKREGKGMSMVTGFNRLLEKIEVLRGGYTDSTFKETVMGLAWVLSEHATQNYVIFEPTKSSDLNNTPEEEIKYEGEEPKEPEETEADDTEEEKLESNGNNIKVVVSGDSGYKKNVTIYQKQDNDKWLKVYGDHRQIYRLETGYEVTSEGIDEDGVATIKVTDEELNEMNNNKTYQTKKDSTLKGLVPDDVKWISLYDLVFDAYVKMLDGITSDGSDAGASDNLITRIVVGIFSDIVDFVESELGMESIEELVYNKEGREYSGSGLGYLLGLFPESWVPIINQGMSMVAIVSILFLTFAILRVLYMMNLDSMNVSTRLNLKQDIANIIYSVLGMMLFITVFYVIALLNYKLTGILYSTMAVENSGEAISFTENFMRDEGLIGGLILRVVMIGVTAYVNVVYIIRGINIGIILMLAPIFIIGTAFNGPERIKVILRELLGNIGIQTLHALLIVFIAKAKASMGIANGGTRLFISVVMASSIIPVTGMFRELVFGENKSLLGAGRIATNAKNTATELGRRGTIMAAGVAGGAIAAGARIQTRDQFNNFNKFNEKRKLKAMTDTFKEAGLGGNYSTLDSEGSTGAGDSTAVSGGTGIGGASTVSGSTGAGDSTAVSGSTGTDDSSTVSGNAGTGDSTAVSGGTGTGDTSNNATPREVNNASKYFDPDLEKGFDRKDRFKVQVANDINNISNLMAVFKSKGKADSVDRFLDGVNQSKEMQKYMRANKYEDRQSQMEKYTKEAEETVEDGNEK